MKKFRKIKYQIEKQVLATKGQYLFFYFCKNIISKKRNNKYGSNTAKSYYNQITIQQMKGNQIMSNLKLITTENFGDVPSTFTEI